MASATISSYSWRWRCASSSDLAGRFLRKDFSCYNAQLNVSNTLWALTCLRSLSSSLVYLMLRLTRSHFTAHLFFIRSLAWRNTTQSALSLIYRPLFGKDEPLKVCWDICIAGQCILRNLRHKFGGDETSTCTLLEGPQRLPQLNQCRKHIFTSIDNRFRLDSNRTVVSFFLFIIQFNIKLSFRSLQHFPLACPLED